jgi:hypothetical protein
MEPTERLLEFLEQECGLAGIPVGHTLARLLLQLIDALPDHLDHAEYVKVLEYIRMHTVLELTQLQGSTLH